jgi:DNA-directed RNA polymerase specialized sigma24 family protein
MIGVALAYVPSRAAAEEAVQEAWIAVMRGIDGFEARSSLKTWIFRIHQWCESRSAEGHRPSDGISSRSVSSSRHSGVSNGLPQ